MPVSTFRAWVIGLFWAIVVPGANQFFYFRYPSVFISGVRLQLICSVISVRSVAKSSPLRKIKYVPILLSFPVGNLWARYVPKVSLFGISLNPGPFTVKEHVIIYIMSSVGGIPTYAVSIAPLSRHPHAKFHSGRDHCRPKGLLQSTPYLCMSVSFFFRLARHFDWYF